MGAMFAASRCLVLLSLAQPVAGDVAASGTCQADGQGCSAGSRGEPLRYRVTSYKDPSKRSVYGGAFVEEALARAGFEGPVEGDDWDLFYTHFPMGKAVEAAGLPPREGRLVNHCQYFTAAGQKCHLAGHLRRAEAAARAARGEDPAIRQSHLETFLLRRPEEAAAWRAALVARPDRHWLVKTCSGGASRGITLVGAGDEAAVQKASGSWAVAQEYLAQPLLSLGHKFHIRLYLHVPRWRPVGVMLFDLGVVFRSRHLHDGKRPVLNRDVFSALSDDVEGVPLDTVWAELGERAAAARRRLLALLAEVFGFGLEESFGDAAKLSARGFSCYDLFGLDVMFDRELRPFLLEVNMGPDLWVDRRGPEKEGFLRVIKEPLVDQLAAWAAARVRLRAADPPLEAVRAIEDQFLVNFTRVL